MPSGKLPGDQLIDCPEECSQRFTATGWRRDEKVLPAGYFLPALLLDLRRLADPFHEPVGDKQVELRKSTHVLLRSCDIYRYFTLAVAKCETSTTDYWILKPRLLLVHPPAATDVDKLSG